jgi:hypothetical protein
MSNEAATAGKISAEDSNFQMRQQLYKQQATAAEAAKETILKFLGSVQRPLIAADIQNSAQFPSELAHALNTLSTGSHLDIRGCGLVLRSLKNATAAGIQLRARPAGGNLMSWYVVPAVAETDELANLETPESQRMAVVNLG